MAWIPSKVVGLKNWSKMFQQEAQKYNFHTTKYVGVTTTTQYLPREKVRKEKHLKTLTVPFEGKLYDAPADYDIYLSQLYGEYMKLPPKEKHGTHHDFMVYKRKKFQKETISKPLDNLTAKADIMKQIAVSIATCDVEPYL